MRLCQRDPRRLLVPFQHAGVYSLDEIELVVEPVRLVGHIAQHLGQVDVVER